MDTEQNVPTTPQTPLQSPSRSVSLPVDDVKVLPTKKDEMCESDDNTISLSRSPSRSRSRYRSEPSQSRSRSRSRSRSQSWSNRMSSRSRSPTPTPTRKLARGKRGRSPSPSLCRPIKKQRKVFRRGTVHNTDKNRDQGYVGKGYSGKQEQNRDQGFFDRKDNRHQGSLHQDKRDNGSLVRNHDKRQNGNRQPGFVSDTDNNFHRVGNHFALPSGRAHEPNRNFNKNNFQRPQVYFLFVSSMLSYFILTSLYVFFDRRKCSDVTTLERNETTLGNQDGLQSRCSMLSVLN
jgi:hypothetical protein